jgi:hypothetical protein
VHAVSDAEVKRRAKLARFTGIDNVLDCKINGSKHMNFGLKKIRDAFVTAAVMALALLASPAARADTETYTYQSQSDLSLGSAVVCSPCELRLTLTVDNVLAPNTTYMWVSSGTTLGTPLDLDPDSSDNFSFLFAASNPSGISLTTDSSGRIFQWAFNLSTSSFPGTAPGCVGNETSSGMDSRLSNTLESADTISVMSCTNPLNDGGEDSAVSVSQGFFVDPWKVKTNVTTAPMPEPSTLALLSIGVLLALAKARSGRKTLGSSATAV